MLFKKFRFESKLGLSVRILDVVQYVGRVFNWCPSLNQGFFSGSPVFLLPQKLTLQIQISFKTLPGLVEK